MKIRSDSFEHGKPIPAEFAMGARDTADGFGGNRNPHLAWEDVPAGTRSFALLCIDTDAPTDGALVADSGTPIPVEHPRGDFVHWAVADMPADVRAIAAGSCSDGVTSAASRTGTDAGGRRGPERLHRLVRRRCHDGRPVLRLRRPVSAPARPARASLLLPRCSRLTWTGWTCRTGFTAGDVFRAMHGHVLAEASDLRHLQPQRLTGINAVP